MVDVTTRLGFCVSGKSIRCNAASRQHLNIPAKMGIMEGLLNWFANKIVTILGFVMARYVG